jgi:hypothetical protein
MTTLTTRFYSQKRKSLKYRNGDARGKQREVKSFIAFCSFS